MQGYNVILVYNPQMDQLLMCHRKKQPYMGLYNLVGGKIEPGEDGLDAAYRELFEETGITRQDITLTHVMDNVYHCSNCYVQAYAGRLKHDVQVYGDENDLLWMSPDQNFFDTTRFAADGNIGHLLIEVTHFAQKVFGK